nr:hypothetical protein [Tanacetum cinerariifolium]
MTLSYKSRLVSDNNPPGISLLLDLDLQGPELYSLVQLEKENKQTDNVAFTCYRSTSDDAQNKNPSVTETGASDSTILSKPAVKFVKAVDKAAERSTTNKVETVKKPAIRYAELYRKPTKKPTVRGNQRNWNNLKKRMHKGTSRSQNKTHESFKSRPVAHKPYRPPVRPMRSNMNDARPNRTTFNKQEFPPVNKKLPTGNSNVSTVCCCYSRHFNTARPKAVINRRNRVNDVKASTCWVWKPVTSNSASIIFKRYDYVDVRGKSRSVMAWVPKKD